MAYRKGARAPKRTFKPKTGKVPKAVKSYVKKAVRVNTELKRYQVPAVIENPEQSVAIYFRDLNSIPEGTGPNERIGQQVRLQGLQLKGVLTNTSTQAIYVRMIVGYLRDDENITLLSQLFKDPDGNATSPSFIGSSTSSLSPIMTPTHPGEIQTLHDSVIKLAPSNSTDGLNTKMYNHFIKLHNRKCDYNFTTSVNAANPRLYAIFLYAESNQDFVTFQTVEHSNLYQLWYRDA